MRKIKIQNLTNHIYIGENFSLDVNKIIDIYNLRGGEIAVFMGKKSFKESKYFNDFLKILSYNEITVIESYSVNPNPKIMAINSAINKIKKNKINLFIALGGGSVLDFAKSCKLYSETESPIFSIYTTLGSATIVSPFVVYDNHEFKIGAHSLKVIPEFVYINTEILNNIPEKILGAGICDIFEHSFESSLSKISTRNSRKDADKSIVYLKKYINSGRIDDLVLADIYAGLSEKVGSVLLPHALGHFLTYRYKISHGYANYLFIKSYLKENNLQISKEYLDIMIFLRKFEKYIPRRKIRRLSKQDLKLINKYMKFAFENSPVKLNEEKIIRIFNNSLQI